MADPKKKPVDEYVDTKNDLIADALKRVRYAKMHAERGEGLFGVPSDSEMTGGERALRKQYGDHIFNDPARRAQQRDSLSKQYYPDELTDLEEPFLRAGVPIAPAENPFDFQHKGIGPGEVRIEPKQPLEKKVRQEGEYKVRSNDVPNSSGTRYTFGATDETPPYQILVPGGDQADDPNRSFKVSTTPQAERTAYDVYKDLLSRFGGAKYNSLSEEARKKADDLLLQKSLVRLRDAGFPIADNIDNVDDLFDLVSKVRHDVRLRRSNREY